MVHGANRKATAGSNTFPRGKTDVMSHESQWSVVCVMLYLYLLWVT
jgi:hypothetical protein